MIYYLKSIMASSFEHTSLHMQYNTLLKQEQKYTIASVSSLRRKRWSRAA